MAVKRELDNIFKSSGPAPFMRSFSMGSPTLSPAVDLNREYSGVGMMEPVPSLPAFGVVGGAASLEENQDEKRVAFGDEKAEGGNIIFHLNSSADSSADSSAEEKESRT